MDALTEYRNQFARNLAAVGTVLDRITDDQFRWRPGPGAWSVSENLLHLITTGRRYLVPIDEGIEKGRSEGWAGSSAFRPSVFERWFIWALEPPVRVKVKAPKVFLPPPAEPVEEVRRDFDALHRDWQRALDASRGLDLKRIQVVSPASSRISISLGAGFAANAAHERRHIWQAGRVMAHPEFPKK